MSKILFILFFLVFSSSLSASKQEELCAICLQELKEEGKSWTLHPEHDNQSLQTPHIFCRECILEWLEKKLTCPLCQQNLEHILLLARESIKGGEEKEISYFELQTILHKNRFLILRRKCLIIGASTLLLVAPLGFYLADEKTAYESLEKAVLFGQNFILSALLSAMLILSARAELQE